MGVRGNGINSFLLSQASVGAVRQFDELPGLGRKWNRAEAQVHLGQAHATDDALRRRLLRWSDVVIPRVVDRTVCRYLRLREADAARDQVEHNVGGERNLVAVKRAIRVAVAV